MDLGESTLLQIKNEVEDLQEDIPEFVKIKQEIDDTQGENLQFVFSKDVLNGENSIENALRANYEAQLEELCQYPEIKQESNTDVTNVANTSIEIKDDQENESDEMKKIKKAMNVSVKCEVCGIICRDRRSYKLHLMDHTGRPYKCDECDKSYKKSIDLLYHKKSHTGDHDIHCEACGKGFAVKSALRAHMRTHSKEKPYICHICNRGFSHSSSLKPHIAMHNDDFSYECKLCPMKFKTWKALNTHGRVHAPEGDKGEQCSLCPKYFKSKEGLRLHLIRHKQPLTQFANPLMYMCEQCGNSYKHAVSLKNHMRSHNGDKFTCHKCGKSYITTKLLNIHVRNHTGETPFSCTVCGKRFKRRDSWLYHKKTHENDRKTYECDMCDKVLVCKSSLRVHKTYIHSNGKPFRCDYCFQSYKLRHDLTKHLRKHKKDGDVKEEIKDGDATTALGAKKETDEKCNLKTGFPGAGLEDLVDVVKMYKCKCKVLFEDESKFNEHKLNECGVAKLENGLDEGKDKGATKRIKEEVAVKTEGNCEDS